MITSNQVYPSAGQEGSKNRESITTGDSRLDEMLGGGIIPGVITELVGESASGKTQLTLQISLLVQLSPGKGGLSGSTCYLTTTGVLPTSRLIEIIQEHPLMTSDVCSLANIHTRHASSVSELQHVLSRGIPGLMRELSKNQSCRPLKLLIIDSMSTLFHSNTKTTSTTLFERSRDLNEIALILHQLASSYSLAIVVVNEVVSIIERESISPLLQYGEDYRMLYSEQSRWFSRGDVSSDEAGLGLGWANQVGLRIMMMRTGRRRHLAHLGAHAKRRKDGRLEGNDDSGGGETTLIRKLSVVFSTFIPPNSVDFIILNSGFVSISEN